MLVRVIVLDLDLADTEGRAVTVQLPSTTVLLARATIAR